MRMGVGVGGLLLQVPRWDFERALERPPISSPIHARYWQCLYVGWPIRKR